MWPTHRPRPVRQGTQSHGVAQRAGCELVGPACKQPPNAPSLPIPPRDDVAQAEHSWYTRGHTGGGRQPQRMVRTVRSRCATSSTSSLALPNRHLPPGQQHQGHHRGQRQRKRHYQGQHQTRTRHGTRHSQRTPQDWGVYLEPGYFGKTYPINTAVFAHQACTSYHQARHPCLRLSTQRRRPKFRPEFTNIFLTQKLTALSAALRTATLIPTICTAPTLTRQPPKSDCSALHGPHSSTTRAYSPHDRGTVRTHLQDTLAALARLRHGPHSSTRPACNPHDRGAARTHLQGTPPHTRLANLIRI